MLLFDLDGTLYPVGNGVLERLDARINDYLREHVGIAAADVDRLRCALRDDHGTTMHGLMARHQIDADHYLDVVHDADLSDLIQRDDPLRAMLARLPGRRVVFTNAPRAHAARVLGLLGIGDVFESVIALEDLAYVPKPRAAAFETVLTRFGVAGEDCFFVDDTRANVLAARRLGMHAVWVAPATQHSDDDAQSAIETVHEVETVLRTNRR
jgi:putative hydrolase of the HAD superfamily